MIADVHSFVPATLKTTGLLIPLPMARSSGGRPGRRRVGRALHPPEECAISLFPHDWGRQPSWLTARTRPERGPQLLVHGRLDRSADVLVDQFAERDGDRKSTRLNSSH